MRQTILGTSSCANVIAANSERRSISTLPPRARSKPVAVPKLSTPSWVNRHGNVNQTAPGMAPFMPLLQASPHGFIRGDLSCPSSVLDLRAYRSTAIKSHSEYDDIRSKHHTQRPNKFGVTHNFPPPFLY